MPIIQVKRILAYRKGGGFKYDFHIKTTETNIDRIMKLVKKEAKRLNRLRKHYGRNKIFIVECNGEKRKV